MSRPACLLAFAATVAASASFVVGGAAAKTVSLGEAREQTQGANGTAMVTIREGTNVAVASAPDGETLALDLLGTIWVMPAGGGDLRRLTDVLGDARQPDWSPDGERIVFQAYRDGNWHLWSVRSSGVDLRQHTGGPFDDREPAWSHDGRTIVFSSDRSGNYDIWELDVESGEIVQVTQHPMADFGPVFAPDDQAIAYSGSREAGNQVILRSSSGEERVAATVDGAVAGASFSPTGTRLIFNEIDGGESRLLLVETADPGASPRAVSRPGEDVFPFRVAWSSDEEFLYTADGLVKRQRISGGVDASLEASEIIEFEARVALNRQPYERRRRDFDATGLQPVRGIISPVVAPTGDAVVFVALGDLWMLPIEAAGADSTDDSTRDGVPLQLTEDAFVERDPTFSPDGRTLAFVSNRAGSFDIWLRDVVSGDERRLTDLPGSELAPAFSPDGSRLSFLDQNGRVAAAEVESGEVAILHAALHMPGRPTWVPDGRTVAVAALTPYSGRFREGVNEFLLVSLDGDDDRRVTPFPNRSLGTRNYDGPVWSPDGKMIAFTAAGTLWAVDVSPNGDPAGTPRQITDELAESPSWTADSGSIVYLHNGDLRRVYLGESRVEEIPLDLSWSRRHPAGRRLVHAGRLFDGRSDAMRTDVDVLIEGHRIAAIEPHAAARHDEIASSTAGEVIDASSRTVMPGLIEMHTHQSSDTHGIWLAYGVTTVREPVTNAYQALERREAIGAGVRPGPREFFTGESFDGSRIYYSSSMALDALRQIELQMERADRLGYDLIKTYVRLPDHLQYAVVAAAHDLGLPVTSHELFPAAAYGADGVEHISGTSRRGYSPKVSLLNRSYQDVTELLARSGMTITPTMGISGGFWLVAARDPSLLADRRFRELFPAALVSSVDARAARLRADPAGLDAIAAGLVAPYGDTLRSVIAGGGRVVAGTDSPIIPAGISLHTELENFVDAGLTPFQALQTATVWAAEALAAGDDLGSVEVGMLADLLIVDGDPLVDIRATRNLRMVIKNGEVYRLEDLLR